MVSGAALLVSFGAFKMWSGHQSDAGINAFETARAQNPMATPVSETPAEESSEPASGNDADWAVSLETALDTSLWSSSRIDQYHAAVRDNDLPSAGQSLDTPQAILNIDHLKIRVPVYNGASDVNLNRGVARIIGTGRVGEAGNLGIAGHRDSFFRPLKDIQLGDRFTLETFSGTEVYEVSEIEIIDPSELHVLAPTDAPMVTLVTCYPFYHVGNAPQRFIVKAEALGNQVNS